MKCWLHALLHATCLISALAAILLPFSISLAMPVQARPIAVSDLDARVENIISLGAPGVLVRVRDGTAVWARAAGLADIARRRTAQADDTWRIASITKIVTATIVLDFVDRNRIRLDMPIGHYLPELAEKTGTVTVRQLLNQTSGIADYTTDASDPLQISAAALSRSLTSPRPPLDMLARALAMPRRTPPGAEHDYSNTNYLLLELLIERAAGRAFREVVADMIVRPLGLMKTGFPDTAGRLPLPHLRGYLPADGSDGPFSDRRTLVDVTEHTYFLGAEGGLYSNLSDLARMIDALWNQRLVDNHTFQEMLSGMVMEHEGRYRYGLGLMARRLSCGVAIYGHEGSDLGIITQVFTNIDNTTQIIVVVNTTFDAATGLESAIDGLVDRAFCEFRPAPEVDK